MPRTIEITIYRLNELDAKARSNARAWYIDEVLNKSNWDEHVLEDFKAIAELMGITIGSQHRKPVGRDTPASSVDCIFYTGFWSQGDGACFEGTWQHREDSRRGVHAYAPVDTTLHAIADQLAVAQEQNAGELIAHMRHHGSSYNEHTMEVEVERAGDTVEEATAETAATVAEAMRDLARWLYQRLQEAYRADTADDAVDETIRANDWWFTATGNVFTATGD